MEIIKIIVSKKAIILKYIYDGSFSSFMLYTCPSPFVNANKPLPADQIVNIIEIEIVPIDFEYTSSTIPIIISFIVTGMIFDIASNNVVGSIPVYCIKVIIKIKNGINDNIV